MIKDNKFSLEGEFDNHHVKSTYCSLCNEKRTAWGRCGGSPGQGWVLTSCPLSSALLDTLCFFIHTVWDFSFAKGDFRLSGSHNALLCTWLRVKTFWSYTELCLEPHHDVGNIHRPQGQTQCSLRLWETLNISNTTSHTPQQYWCCLSRTRNFHISLYLKN